jgi:hypothetical protein
MGLKHKLQLYLTIIWLHFVNNTIKVKKLISQIVNTLRLIYRFNGLLRKQVFKLQENKLSQSKFIAKKTLKSSIMKIKNWKRNFKILKKL